MDDVRGAYAPSLRVQTAPELEDAGILIIQNWDSYFFHGRFDFPGTYTIHGMVLF